MNVKMLCSIFLTILFIGVCIAEQEPVLVLHQPNQLPHTHDPKEHLEIKGHESTQPAVTSQVIADERHAFGTMDVNKDGKISADDIINVLLRQDKNIKREKAEEEAHDMIEAAGSKDKGYVSFLDFFKMRVPKATEEDLKHLAQFLTFDLDGDSYVSRNDLRRVLTNLEKKPPTEEELDDMFKYAGSKIKGLVDFGEFVNIVKHGKTLYINPDTKAHADKKKE